MSGLKLRRCRLCPHASKHARSVDMAKAVPALLLAALSLPLSTMPSLVAEVIYDCTVGFLSSGKHTTKSLAHMLIDQMQMRRGLHEG